MTLRILCTGHFPVLRKKLVCWKRLQCPRDVVKNSSTCIHKCRTFSSAQYMHPRVVAGQAISQANIESTARTTFCIYTVVRKGARDTRAERRPLAIERKWILGFREHSAIRPRAALVISWSAENSMKIWLLDDDTLRAAAANADGWNRDTHARLIMICTKY